MTSPEPTGPDQRHICLKTVSVDYVDDTLRWTVYDPDTTGIDRDGRWIVAGRDAVVDLSLTR